MKVKVPGASGSEGVKAVDFSLPKGDYVFEIGTVEIKESQKSPCLIHAFSMVVLDGPDDEKTGKTTQGRKYTHRIIQLLPEHDSFNPSDTRAADEIADLCAAAGVDLDEDDSYETDDFPGTKVCAKLGVKQGKDESGEPRNENTILQQKSEDGVRHLWLPDGGAPVSRKPAAKASPAKGGSKKGSPKKR